MGLKSDGTVAAIGYNGQGQCDIPELEAGLTYTQVAAGVSHSLLLKSDGTAAAIGYNGSGQCDIPKLPEDQTYVRSGIPEAQNTMVLQLSCRAVADEVIL